MKRTAPPVTTPRALTLVVFALATVVSIPAGLPLPGAVLLLVSFLVARRTGDSAFVRRMSVLYVVVLVLGLIDINTGLSTPNFLTVGGGFLFAVVFPALALRGRPGALTYRFIPRRNRWRILAYVLLSIPLAWGIIEIYFTLNPWMPTHWLLPAHRDPESFWRLFTGINLVGLWDELFFVNTVFGILRTLFPYRWANAGQAVVYASVLYDMAFTGLGVVIVPVFAWTQGAMFESSEGLLGVLTVHIIVDFFLFTAIVHHYYPGFSLGWH